MFIGAPVLPLYLYETGITETLDAMQAPAGVNTVMTFSHTHVFRQYRPGFAPLYDENGYEITDVFVRTHATYYQHIAQYLRTLAIDVWN